MKSAGNPEFSNLQERRAQRKIARGKRGPEEERRKCSEYSSATQKMTQMFSKMVLEDLFEEVEEYFHQSECSPEIDAKKYRITAHVKSEECGDSEGNDEDDDTKEKDHRDCSYI